MEVTAAAAAAAACRRFVVQVRDIARRGRCNFLVSLRIGAAVLYCHVHSRCM